MQIFSRTIITVFILAIGYVALGAFGYAAVQPFSIPGEDPQPLDVFEPQQTPGPTIFQVIEEVVTRYIPINVPPQCPRCPQAKNICSINAQDTADSKGNFDLSYECEGVYAPCRIDAVAGSADPEIGDVTDTELQNLEGAASWQLNLGGAPAVTYKLYDNTGNQCAFGIAHAQQTGQAPIVISAAAGALTNQSGYRWFANADDVDPGAALAALNTVYAAAFTGGEEVRLRLLLHESAGGTVSTGTFKLQAGSIGVGPDNCGLVTYADVGTTAGLDPLFLFNDNASPDDGAAISLNLTVTHDADTVAAQTYEEANNFSVASDISAAGDGQWDFSLVYDAGVVVRRNDPFQKSFAHRFIQKVFGDFIPAARAGEFPSTFWCFRVVESDGTVLTTYEQYPEIEDNG